MRGYESTVHTSTGAAKAGPARLLGIVVVGDGGAATVNITDGNGGTVRLEMQAPSGDSRAVIFGEECALLFSTSIYLATMTTAKVTLITE